MPHTTSLTVRFNELDPYAHVNHAAYVTYFEVARTEALDASDMGITRVADAGFQLVVVEINVKYRSAAVMGDALEIDTWITERKRATMRWSQALRRGDEVLVTEDIHVAVTDTDGRPVRPPAWLFEYPDFMHVPPG
ncbi:MAG: acyl-CoA thioesterase [Acidimicrobiales bacterium]